MRLLYVSAFTQRRVYRRDRARFWKHFVIINSLNFPLLNTGLLQGITWYWYGQKVRAEKNRYKLLLIIWPYRSTILWQLSGNYIIPLSYTMSCFSSEIQLLVSFNDHIVINVWPFQEFSDTYTKHMFFYLFGEPIYFVVHSHNIELYTKKFIIIFDVYFDSI